MNLTQQKQSLLRKGNMIALAIVALLYVIITVVLSKFYVTVQYIPSFLDTISWVQFLLSIALTLIIGILLGINVVLLYLAYQEYKQKKHTHKMTELCTTASVTSVGALGGVATGVCSACVASIFPWLLGLFSITISFGALPFQGLEIQGGIVLLLAGNGYYLHKKIIKGGNYG